MKLVCNKLKIVEASNEEAILGAITAMEVKNAADLKDLQDKLNAKMAEKDAVDKEVKDLKDKVAAYDAAKAEADKTAAAKAKAETAAKAEVELKNAVTSGKIKNDADTIAKWKAKFETDFDGTKELMDLVPSTRKAAVFNATPAAAAAAKAKGNLTAEVQAELVMNQIEYGSMEHENMLKLKEVQGK